MKGNEGRVGGTEVTDAALVEQCLAGQRDCFAELVRRHRDSVFNLAYRMTNNWADANELAQEAFVKAYGKLARYKPKYSFRNWVMTICANLTKNRFRGNERRRRAELVHLELEDGRSSGSDPRHAALEKALGKLERTLRVPLTLKHVEGLSYSEITGILDISLSAAKMRVKRGRDQLEQILRGEEHTP